MRPITLFSKVSFAMFLECLLPLENVEYCGEPSSYDAFHAIVNKRNFKNVGIYRSVVCSIICKHFTYV